MEETDLTEEIWCALFRTTRDIATSCIYCGTSCGGASIHILAWQCKKPVR